MDEGLIADKMKAYGNSVLRVAASVTGNLSDAEDVFSDVFFTLWRTGQTFLSEEHCKAWLVRVAINKAKNIRKQAYNRYKTTMPDNVAAAQNQPCNDVTKALQRLKSCERAVVYLHYYEGYGYGEIAETMNLRENTVRSKALRARAQMEYFLSK